MVDLMEKKTGPVYLCEICGHGYRDVKTAELLRGVLRFPSNVFDPHCAKGGVHAARSSIVRRLG